MKRNLLLILTAGCLILSGCGAKNYADGTYSARSTEYHNEDETDDSGNGYGVVTLTVKYNRITECEFKTYELNGTLKDTEYGKENGEIANKDFYNKAQKAVGACDQYAAALVSAGNIKDVDAISGATITTKAVVNAVNGGLRVAQDLLQGGGQNE